ncbi:aminodeoxychorismate/anthranilate synthase component I [Komagataeibacter nataicola]|uniref:Aminodeoxychorismate/anthranilate synthase component I n=1 Tax=Komagataeibacter nataicola TaxID=265960 RepID=A0A9N7H3Q8_9PROT|nr:anthranilate synthase component I family protein [Komagataeibacter nataicola]AQU88983.1 aminodeoxychorismate/anthranilate synthase component I [Komagataeibacter nataicola]PYD67103.1 aminodeoxychorismate/anthranilate synthase component I [Komagataeibacter nataicola]WEQ55344.1 anthranilate synthase component I family protein [Komagataeibacter nataicola]GBR17954.1 para-aminobenzoate synthase component I [Komagataeibacter nataicola NRIC 0616]
MASSAPCLPLAWRDVDDVLAAWGDQPGFVCLDSGGPVGPRARWTIICRDPAHWIEQRDGMCWLDGTQVAHDLPGLLRQCVPGGCCPPEVPFAGGAIGFIGYGAGQRMEGIGTRHGAGDDGPEAAFGLYDHAFVLDRKTGRAWLAGTDLDAPHMMALAAQWAAMAPAAKPPPLPALRFRPDQDGAAYRAAVAQTVARIAAGEVFQVNITGRMRATRPPGLSAVDVYRTLRATSPAPFGAFMVGEGGFALLGASPERFLRLDGAGRVSTRPIKGTAPRGGTAQDDARLAHALRHDAKERAENLMIVDLMRNDIGRVAQMGSIAVPELFAVEQFAHVHHLVSEITGRLAPEHDACDLLAATLPPGSVTGAPKHRAMQVIDALEASPRGAYCGAVVRIGSDGTMDSAVIIRTLVLTRDHVTAAAGGGITVESDPEREYREMQLKIAALLALFGPQVDEGNMP